MNWQPTVWETETWLHLPSTLGTTGQQIRHTDIQELQQQTAGGNTHTAVVGEHPVKCDWEENRAVSANRQTWCMCSCKATLLLDRTVYNRIMVVQCFNNKSLEPKQNNSVTHVIAWCYTEFRSCHVTSCAELKSQTITISEWSCCMFYQVYSTDDKHVSIKLIDVLIECGLFALCKRHIRVNNSSSILTPAIF